jgi:hypothetical protein
MKKIFLSIVALVGLASFASAATPTNTVTPNATLTAAQTQIQQTQTAIAATATYVATFYPTLTPTLTPTGTITPSLSPTPPPVQLKPNERFRVYFIPSDLTQADGISVLGATALPGATSAWMAQSLSQSVAVLSTGTCEVRQTLTIPWNYKGRGELFAVMGNQTTGDSVTITASVAGQRFNNTTQTAGVFSYVQPAGGVYYFPGAATNVISAVYLKRDALYTGSSTLPQVVSRVLMPLAANAYMGANTNPSLAQTFQPGDIVNFDIKRTTGGSGNVYIYGLEFQYEGNQGLPM